MYQQTATAKAVLSQEQRSHKGQQQQLSQQQVRKPQNSQQSLQTSSSTSFFTSASNILQTQAGKQQQYRQQPPLHQSTPSSASSQPHNIQQHIGHNPHQQLNQGLLFAASAAKPSSTLQTSSTNFQVHHQQIQPSSAVSVAASSTATGPAAVTAVGAAVPSTNTPSSKMIPSSGHTVAATQRRFLASPFPVPYHGPASPSTPTGTSASSPSRIMLSSPNLHGRDDNSLKTYTMTPPSVLQSLLKDNPDAGYPDFYPWTGSQPEDSLTESYIQHGYEDKPFLSNETGSARSNLLSTLRKQSTLDLLSVFMTNAMQKREEINKIQSPSTFKPPPRVTLTDQKREAWLRDLVTPSVPLRRLSRTIPHGIRNRVLVEQCCNKAVPIHRAVWLARCVGANELRSLKRKGNSASLADAEAQWIREWTIQVAQFIEKVLSECGNNSDTLASTPANTPTTQPPKWRTRADYIIRFAAHLYSEDLLDRAYFLDWTILLLEKIPLERLPLPLVLIRLFWSRLIKHPAKCKKLAQVLLTHMKSMAGEIEANRTARSQLYQKLQMQLAICIWELMKQVHDAFLIPENWHSVRSVLYKSVRMANPDKSITDKVFETIALENMSLSRQSTLFDTSNSSKDSEQEQRARLISVIASASIPYDIDVISDELILAASIPPSCYDGNDPQQLVDVLCEWALCEEHSASRVLQAEEYNLAANEVKDNAINLPNEQRTDIISSLFRKWTSMKKPVLDSLFKFFDSFLDLENINLDLAKLFLAQLVNKGVLLPDIYIRKLISRGIFLLPDMKHKIPSHRFVLKHLPLDEYSISLQNQRNTLLANNQPKAGID
ncbi:uncharacterized protein V1516DRAFT_690973 [Lipomyces oligophaga]|uniref:uncharacterized protein n=1 Tax=Lipomyces oligophaga TaxID=45792 RepID=UPI0034CD7F62